MYEYYNYTDNKVKSTIRDDQINDDQQINIKPQYSRMYSENERIGCSWENFFAISAIFRMFFLCFALIGVISSAVSKNQEDNGYFTSYGALRIAYLSFSCAIFVYEAVILTLDIINVFNTPKLKKCPINIVILIIDCVLFFGILICSIFAFTKAKYMAQDIKSVPIGPPLVASSYFKADAFYVMSIIGYLMSMLFVEEIIYLIFQILARFLSDKKAAETKKNPYYQRY